MPVLAGVRARSMEAHEGYPVSSLFEINTVCPVIDVIQDEPRILCIYDARKEPREYSLITGHIEAQDVTSRPLLVRAPSGSTQALKSDCVTWTNPLVCSRPSALLAAATSPRRATSTLVGMPPVLLLYRAPIPVGITSPLRGYR